MKFTNDYLDMFINDIPFYIDKDCFCIGNTLEEAGEIVREIIKKEDIRESVGMAI